MPGLKNDWVNGDLFTPAAANDMANAVNNAQQVPTPTAVKTAAYTAAVGELVPADAASGGFTVTLPAAPASGSTVWVKKIDTTTNTVTVQRGNSTDVFNETSGPTLLQLAVPGESVQVQYKSGVWYVVSHSFAVPGLDKRYVRQGPSGVAGWYNIQDSNGANAITIKNTTDAVNYLSVSNSSGNGRDNPVLLAAESLGSNASLKFRPKGTGYFNFETGSATGLVLFVPIASAVNSWRFDNSATGNAITCRANGNDPDVSFDFVPQGSGNLRVNNVAVLTTGGALGTPSSGTLTNCTFPTLNQNTSGTAAGLSSTLAVSSGGTGVTTLTGLVKGNGTGAMNAAVAGTDFIAPGGDAGTPSSLTLTNATGLPVSGISASTSTALGVGSIELGHANDTTLTRSAAGILAVEGVAQVNVSSQQTLTNKTLTSPKVNAVLDTNGNSILTLNAQSSSVNYVTFQNAATGSYPQIRAGGSDSSIPLVISGAGANGSVLIADSGNSFATIAQFYGGVASPVNYWQFNPSASGNAIKANAVGSSTDISVNVVPKGAGRLQSGGVTVPTISSNDVLTNKSLTSPALTTPTLSSSTPASASASGTTGTVVWDADYIYICTATNTWKRAAIATW
jgi:hypothetical protein